MPGAELGKKHPTELLFPLSGLGEAHDGNAAGASHQFPAEWGAKRRFPPDCFPHSMTAEGGVGLKEFDARKNKLQDAD